MIGSIILYHVGDVDLQKVYEIGALYKLSTWFRQRVSPALQRSLAYAIHARTLHLEPSMNLLPALQSGFYFLPHVRILLLVCPVIMFDGWFLGT